MTRPAPLLPAEAPPRRSDRFDQSAVLRAALDSLAGPETLAIFDLDSTLLDNRPRQARILREYGAAAGEKLLEGCRAEHWDGWDFAVPMARCGLSEAQIAAHLEPAKAYWRERFFTSEYCVDDLPGNGAASFLHRVKLTGATLCYVTGRHTPMGIGTVETFRKAGFPLPDSLGVHLLLKPHAELGDDEWKVLVRERLQSLGRVACAFDNEPSHINSYHEAFDGCRAVHLDTDHSGRPVEVHPDIPSIRDFVL